MALPAQLQERALSCSMQWGWQPRCRQEMPFVPGSPAASCNLCKWRSGGAERRTNLTDTANKLPSQFAFLTTPSTSLEA